MDISEMPTERAFECMARMAPYVAEIAGDARLAEAKRALREKEGGATNGDFMAAIYPLLMREHREAVCGIAAALSGRSVAEVKAQPYRETFEAMQAGFTGELFDFFPFAVRLAARA